MGWGAAGSSWHEQRASAGTLAMTMSAWLPHPAQVVLPQEWQVAGLHMRDLTKG